MSFEHLPEQARNSALISALDVKLQTPPSMGFDYRGELVKLANRVTAEISHINELFPEFTPHDAHYHVNRLFHVADVIVERKRLNEMNCAELFTLAAALYAHDWGMAVSRTEREAILHLSEGQGFTQSATLLSNERDRLLKFAKTHGCVAREVVADDDLWRLYVRETHADRSATRALEFFRECGGGMGDAVGRASRGHGVDIAELDKENEFPTNFSVHGQIVNLRGVALFVRLIDLLDIASDRTPYAVWKFVAPNDKLSAREWEKHRALNPVTCPSYQNGRMVLVDGTASEPEVWAALRDLERYVRAQVRECNDLLARLADRRYHLDLPIVEWRISTPGFRPIDLRFEFLRERMFGILSEEIYDGDVYVFLRELLQNSIDAIRVREGILAKTGLSMAGVIHFEVSSTSPMTVTISCHDNGIGMDEHIVRNYLAVAGRSYYASDEFEHLGIEMDAIGRFGIGILSCFMPATSIEILTRRDPTLAEKNEALKVIIPSVERQFRVYTAGSDLSTGTSVIVHASINALALAPAGWNARYRVADYLAAVGAFTPYPILVSEGTIDTMIVGLDVQVDAARAGVVGRIGRARAERCEVRKIGGDYPWAKFFLLQDVENAKRFLRVRWLDITNDLRVEGCEGRIGFLLPKEDTMVGWLVYPPHDPDVRGISFHTDAGAITLRWHYSGFLTRRQRPDVPRSIDVLSEAYIYCNGILVVNNGEASTSFYENFLPPAVAYVNFPRSGRVDLNVARQNVRGNLPPWRKMITAAVEKFVLAEEREKLIALEPIHRLNRIAKIMAWYELSAEAVASCLEAAKWPIVILDSENKLKVIECGSWDHREWAMLGNSVGTDVLFDLRGTDVSAWHGLEAKVPWDGGEAVLTIHRSFGADYTSKALHFSGWVAERLRPLERIRFVQGPRSAHDVMRQDVRFTSASKWGLDALREAIILDSMDLDAEAWCLAAQLDPFGDINIRVDLGWFVPPYEELMGCGAMVLNTSHRVTRMLLRCGLALRLARETQRVEAKEIGVLTDVIANVFDILWKAVPPSVFKASLERCRDAFEQCGLLRFSEVCTEIAVHDFVPDTAWEKDGNILLLHPAQYFEWNKPSAGFGRVLGSEKAERDRKGLGSRAKAQSGRVDPAGRQRRGPAKKGAVRRRRQEKSIESN